MASTPGLRLKFNLALVPLVAVGIAIMIWADYRHEYATLMEAHAAHTSTIGTGAVGGPMDPWTLPDVAARRSLTFHLVYGGALVALVIGAVNVVLGWYILRPVALMRQRLTGLQRGQWRGRVDESEGDELGRLYEGFQRLGPELDALVAHILHAERLAMLALVSKRFERHVAPEVETIAGIAGRLAGSSAANLREDGETLARAGAQILRALHEYDAAFSGPPASRTWAGTEGSQKSRVKAKGADHAG